MSYFVINLEKVYKQTPYTLRLEGDIGSRGTPGKKYIFEYTGDIDRTDAPLSKDIKEKFEEMLWNDYGDVSKLDNETINNQFNSKKQYRIWF